MLNINEYRKMFADKLTETTSFDDAFRKCIHRAYQHGVSDTTKDWDEARVDVIGQNGNDGLHY